MEPDRRDTTSSIVRDYYRTTAIRSHRPQRASYERWAATQGRRLLPVIRTDRTRPVVDLACGTGEFLYCLRQAGYTSLTGVDLSEGVLDAARPFLPGTRLVNADIFSYLRTATPSSIGVISGQNIVEHLQKSALLDFFTLAYRALEPGGQLLIVVPNAVSILGTIPRYWDVTHEIAFSPNSIEQLSTAAGFTRRPEFFEVGPVPHGIKSTIRWLAWKVLRQEIRLRLLIESGATRTNVFTQDMIVSLEK